MSELKAIESATAVIENVYLVYRKSEADKVIAEKDAKILTLDAEIFKQKHHAELFFDERNYAETQLRRQKYKRCLRNAEGCKNKAWFYGEVHDRNAALTMWKWRKRWLELAEQFKETK